MSEAGEATTTITTSVPQAPAEAAAAAPQDPAPKSPAGSSAPQAAAPAALVAGNPSGDAAPSATGTAAPASSATASSEDAEKKVLGESQARQRSWLLQAGPLSTCGQRPSGLRSWYRGFPGAPGPSVPSPHPARVAPVLPSAQAGPR
jgi:hypothetical protein